MIVLKMEEVRHICVLLGMGERKKLMMLEREEMTAGVTSLSTERRWDPLCRGGSGFTKGSRAQAQNMLRND